MALAEASDAASASATGAAPASATGAAPASATGAPPAFDLMAKPTGAVCNLDCAYCFFLSKEMLYPGSRFRMADELLETYIRQLIEAHARAPVVQVAWQGGEPTLMGVEFFRRSVELVNRYMQQGQRAAYTIQTNGTKLEEEWAAFFKEHDFLVGISIDGPRELHDTFRVTKGGRGSFDHVIRGLGYLRAGGVDFNVLSTVHAANQQHGREVYPFIRDECGARFMQFIPIIERVAEPAQDGTVPWSSWRDRRLYVQRGDVVTGRSVNANGYGRFLVDVFEEWVRHDVGRVYVQMFDTAPANWALERPSLCECDVRFACHGGCPKDSFTTSPDGEAGLNYLCPSYKDFFHHVDEPMQAMAGILTAGRAPAEIMDDYAAADASRGRTEPCTCGHGRKWKQCHGNAWPPGNRR